MTIFDTIGEEKGVEKSLIWSTSFVNGPLDAVYSKGACFYFLMFYCWRFNWLIKTGLQLLEQVKFACNFPALFLWRILKRFKTMVTECGKRKVESKVLQIPSDFSQIVILLKMAEIMLLFEMTICNWPLIEHYYREHFGKNCIFTLTPSNTSQNVKIDEMVKIVYIKGTKVIVMD